MSKTTTAENLDMVEGCMDLSNALKDIADAMYQGRRNQDWINRLGVARDLVRGVRDEMAKREEETR